MVLMRGNTGAEVAGRRDKSNSTGGVPLAEAAVYSLISSDMRRDFGGIGERGGVEGRGGVVCGDGFEA